MSNQQCGKQLAKKNNAKNNSNATIEWDASADVEGERKVTIVGFMATNLKKTDQSMKQDFINATGKPGDRVTEEEKQMARERVILMDDIIATRAAMHKHNSLNIIDGKPVERLGAPKPVQMMIKRGGGNPPPPRETDLYAQS